MIDFIWEEFFVSLYDLNPKIVSSRTYLILCWFINPIFLLYLCQRPYHAEYTSSRPITEVKQRRAPSVLGWVTAWEHGVLLAFFFEYFKNSAFSGCKISEPIFLALKGLFRFESLYDICMLTSQQGRYCQQTLIREMDLPG